MSAESGSSSMQTQTLEDRQSTYDARLRDALTTIMTSGIIPSWLRQYYGNDDTLMCLTENKLTRYGISRMQEDIPIVRETELDYLIGTSLPDEIERERRDVEIERTRGRQARSESQQEGEDQVSALEKTLAALRVLKGHVCPEKDSKWSQFGPKDDISAMSVGQDGNGSQLSGVNSADWSTKMGNTEWHLMRKMELLASFVPAMIAGDVATSTDKDILTGWRDQMNSHVNKYKTRVGVGRTRGRGTTLNVPPDQRGFGQREKEPTWNADREKYVDLMDKTQSHLQSIAERESKDGGSSTNDRCYNRSVASWQNQQLRDRWWDERLVSGQVSLCDDLPQYELNGDVHPEE